jgi:hypothetical protein
MLLLVFGGVISIAAIVLLRHPSEQSSFLVAGLALECLGLALVARDYAQIKRDVA